MIGSASLPKATLPTPATTTHEPHAAPSHADRTDEPRAAPHERHEADSASRADRASAHDPHARPAQASTRTQRAARRSRDGRTEADDAPARDAFARLLEQAPASAEPAKPALPTTSVTTPETGPSTTDTKPGSLPDQLLGLLASLAPGAQPAPANANATPTGSTPAPMPAPTATTVATAKPATPRADAAAALLPALQANGATSSAASMATSALAGALHADEPGTPLPALHDAARNDTPAPTPFDALLRAPTVTAADVPRPVVPATPTPVAQPTDPRAGYGDELGSSVVWMADQRIGHAEVRVVPDHLGPIDVRLQLDGAQVHATFLSAQPEVRHALEASLPRLRDLLGQHGLELAQADVGQRQQDPRAARGGQQAPVDAREAGDTDLAPTQAGSRSRVVRGLLDEYA